METKATDYNTIIDETDKKILEAMFDIKDTNLQSLADRVGISKSTVHNRLKKMRDANFLQGIIPIINKDYVDNQITAISLIKAKYGPEYAEEVGKRISKIKGVWAVYFVLGINDFVVLIRTKTKSELEQIVNELSKTEGVERSDTTIALKIIKEDVGESLKYASVGNE
ncbi:ArsR family transcriptional regulator [Thermogymnomonas acidicola]|uniref:ArsR family transcriptional regulator n=1 Tax=Thermogymnomonas acidicola TaxID=399579 RepID=A0AA37BQK4_9ARCH|nr:Lrp/AsnC family transcriptional regulator [Thermogymnomonas acidicola]GGM70582.1 ArsR family transcriptional regulator [Thermogymnomonas acidicola]